MYIEEVVFLNFVIDYIILYVLTLILNNNVSNKRIMICSMFGELSLILLFVNINYYLVIFFKFLLGLLMIFIYGGYNNRKSFFTNLIWFYSLSFFLGGFLYYIKLNVYNYKYYLLLVPVILNLYKYFIKDLINNLPLRHKVNIYLSNGEILYLNGYMDTGNTLVEPYENRKVIIINNANINEDYFLVPYETIDGCCLMKCFKPKKVFIDGFGDRNDIVVGVINRKFNGFECLLNYNLLEGICIS